MRYLLIIGVMLMGSACSQTDTGKGMMRTVVSTTFPQIPSAIPYTATPIRTLNLPNLRVLSARNSYIPTDCWIIDGGNEHVMWIEIINDGTLDVGMFHVRFNGNDVPIANLKASEHYKLELLFKTNDPVVVKVDPLNNVQESNETDNVFYGMILTFTPPPNCTQTPTAIPTSI